MRLEGVSGLIHATTGSPCGVVVRTSCCAPGPEGTGVETAGCHRTPVRLTTVKVGSIIKAFRLELAAIETGAVFEKLLDCHPAPSHELAPTTPPVRPHAIIGLPSVPSTKSCWLTSDVPISPKGFQVAPFQSAA